jgi:hypothetical protein
VRTVVGGPVSAAGAVRAAVDRADRHASISGVAPLDK